MGRDACQYGGCANTRKSRPALTFFRFPTKAHRCAAWVAGCGNPALVGKTKRELSYFSVCEIHFTADSFMRPDRNDRLIWNAVPTLEDHTTDQTCCVFGCKERYVKDGPVTFHSFPEEPSLRGAWTRALGRANYSPDETSRICSRHFSADCFSSLGVLGPRAEPTEFGLYSDHKKAPAILPDNGDGATSEYLIDELPPDIKEEPLDLGGYEDPLNPSPPPHPPSQHEDSKDFPVEWPPPVPGRPPTVIQTPTQRFVVIPQPAGSDLPASLVFLPPSPPTSVRRVKKRQTKPPATKKPMKKTPTVPSSTEVVAPPEGPELNMVFVKVEENWDEADSAAEPRLSIVETTSMSDPEGAPAMSWTMRLHPDVEGETPASDSVGVEGEATNRPMDQGPSPPPYDRSDDSEPESPGAEPEVEGATPASSALDPLGYAAPADVRGLLVVGQLEPTLENIVRLQQLLLEERAKTAALEKRLEKERSYKVKLKRKLKATEQRLRRIRDRVVGGQLARGVVAPAPAEEGEGDFA